MSDEKLYDRLQAVIDWFEKVPSKVYTHDGAFVAYQVEASDWRAIRSELNQIANETRGKPKPEVKNDNYVYHLHRDGRKCAFVDEEWFIVHDPSGAIRGIRCSRNHPEQDRA